VKLGLPPTSIGYRQTALQPAGALFQLPRGDAMLDFICPTCGHIDFDGADCSSCNDRIDGATGRTSASAKH
jgi:predicted RNA-binding Zn-ribbon protein involved in translation (DUF1610 family)